MTKARSPVAFGQYVITRRIARGGMAEIYRARTRNEAPNWCAVKMMRPSLGHEELRERLFKREARIASQLDHANVVPVYEYGQEMGRPYLAMEYVLGRDLSHLLKNEKKGRDLLPFELGLYIGYAAAAGLGHAHRLAEQGTGAPLGIVHRDVSPGNVMVGYNGAVKVLDFGVARMNETQGVHTQTGTLRGKFAYMSPEQTLGEDLDARSDVFSLGTVLYELLTGTNCFRAENPIATLERVQGLRPVPPSRANRAIPKTVDRVLARCLAKDKKRRFKDCKALEDVLGEFLDRRNYDGRAALVEHMEAMFSWEKHEEGQELTREEEEVALFDVVDFAVLADLKGLDARNVRVSEQEEASQAEVKRGAIKKETENEAVFDSERAERDEQPTSRLEPGLHRAAGIAQISDLEEEEEKTVAQPNVFVDADDQALAGEVAVSSLLGAVDPTALPDEEPSQPSIETTAGGVVVSSTDFVGGGRTIAQSRPVPIYKRPIAWASGLIGVVLLVAAVVAVNSQETSAPPVEPEEPLALSPIDIELDAPVKKTGKNRRRTKKAPRRAEIPNTKVAPAVRLDATPVSALPDKKEPDPVVVPPPKRAQPAVVVQKQTRRSKSRRRRGRSRSRKESGTGYLNVGAQPWARFKIDGKLWPYQTPQASIRLPAGRHTIVLFNDKTGVTRTRGVTIKQGDYTTINENMNK